MTEKSRQISFIFKSILFISLAAIFARCGEADQLNSLAGNEPTAPKPVQATPAPGQCLNAIDVSLTDARTFSPATLQVKVGDTVRWTNSSGIVHTVTADPSIAQDASHVALPANVSPFNSGSLAPGQIFTYTFNVPGTYKYFCIPHEDAGMVGTITVAP